MKVSIILAWLLLLSSAIACAAQNSISGEWVGGYEINGNYVPINARFKSESSGISATLDLPTRRITGVALNQIRFLSPNLHFEWTSAGSLVFEGQLSGDFITGNAEYPGGRGTFHLVRTVTLDSKVFDLYTGDYQIGRDRYISIERTSFPTDGITFGERDSSSPGHRSGQLFPTSETTFVAGSGRWIPYPVEINAAFVKNEQSQVTALRWKPKGSAEIIARKVKLHLYNEEEVKFSSGNVTLAGTLTLPLSKGPHPAVVFIHGSDPNTRFRGGLPRFFAQHGIAALSYDKRGAGDSTGDLQTATFDDLAADASAGVRFLRNRQDINAGQVGVWAVSQGGWIAPIVATRTPNVAFMILHAGPAVTPREQSRMELVSISYGYSQDELKEAIAYLNLYHEAMRSDSAYEKLQAAYEQAQARGASWVWNPGTKENLQQRWFRLIMDFDPVPVLEKVKCPVLAFFGEKDGLVPPEGNVAKMETALKKAGNLDVTIKVLPGVNHRFEVPGIGVYGVGSSGKVPPGYYDVMIEWLKKRVNIR